MNIAILGTGSVGTTLGTAFAAAGHSITYGSRTPDAAAGTLSIRDAAAGADIIVTAVPGTATLEILDEIGAETLGGRIVLDVSNAFTPDFALAYPNDSVARLAQERFPTAKVVKSLSTMNVSVMTNPGVTASPTTVFVSGEDAEAKAAVRSLLTDIGWAEESILDLGGIASAVGVESYGLLFLSLIPALGTPTFNISVER